MKLSKDYNLQTVTPILAQQWHPSKNGNLTPRDITPNSHKKVWWICEKNHEWQATVNNLSSGRGCPYCSGQLVCVDNCLQTANPALAKEWHPSKNGNLTPRDITPNSHKKVWWICEKNHEWQATVNNLSSGRGCPYCSGQLACVDNCLQTANPALAKEWHPSKNGDLTPRDVTPNSNKKVWWISMEGHEWQATVNNRSHGRGCPVGLHVRPSVKQKERIAVVKELKISIYEGNAVNPDTVIKIPLTTLKIACALIPKKVSEKMGASGIDFQEILKLAEAGNVSGKLLEIQDKNDHIVISIE